MPDKDELDRLLDLALFSYGDPGPDSGLEQRILARTAASPSLPRRLSLLRLAVPIAACALLLLTLPRHRPDQSDRPQHVASPVINQAAKSPAVRPLPSSHAVVVHHAKPGPVQASPTRPRLDVFPTPAPLTSQELALVAVATQVPEKQRESLIRELRRDEALMRIAAIHIPPLDTPEEGKN